MKLILLMVIFKISNSTVKNPNSTDKFELYFLNSNTYDGSMEQLLFLCKTINSSTPIISWEINKNGIGSFNLSEVVIAKYFSNFTYVASLFAVRQILGLYSLDSILLVSVPSDSSVQVTCASDDGHVNISNQVTPIYEVNHTPQRQGPVFLLPVFESSNNGDNLNIGAYICVSNTTLGSQTLETNANDSFIFNSSFEFGAAENRPNSSRDYLTLQAIFLGQYQENLRTILYVNDSNISVVRCTAGNYRVEYQTNLIIRTSEKGRLNYRI